MTDRHKKPKVTLRATPAQFAAWQREAHRYGGLNAFIVQALDSHVASVRTARLRLNKRVNAMTRRRHPLCDDRHCSKQLNHQGKCDFLRETIQDEIEEREERKEKP